MLYRCNAGWLGAGLHRPVVNGKIINAVLLQPVVCWGHAPKSSVSSDTQMSIGIQAAYVSYLSLIEYFLKPLIITTIHQAND